VHKVPLNHTHLVYLCMKDGSFSVFVFDVRYIH